MTNFPESIPEPYDFSDWDQAHFYLAGVMLTNLANRKDTTSMRDALLKLYFEEGYGD